MDNRIIDINNLTKDYGHGRGIFDVSIQVKKGECYGFLGPNGAGKTTTIRHLMGFSKPQQGSCHILGNDCWEESAPLKRKIGYLPGEIAFPSAMTGTQFLKMMMKMRNVKDDSYCKELIKRFQLEPDVLLEDMSLGVRRKMAVVTAFLHDPEILILDEPTSGLDPMMQQNFIDYIVDEKKRGKTILLSSHIFHEVDATCDRIAVIKDGKIVSEFITEELKKNQDSIYIVSFGSMEDVEEFMNLPYDSLMQESKLSLRVRVGAANINQFVKDLCRFDVIDFREIPFTLEDYFMGFYKNDHVFEEVK